MSHFSIICYLGKQRDKVTPSRVGTTIAEINVDPTANNSRIMVSIVHLKDWRILVFCLVK